MRRLLGIAAASGWLAVAGAASAAPGDLDPSFGTGGTLTTAFAGADSGSANGMLIQPDGRIVAAGFASFAAGNQFAIARYLPDGTLDQDFGDGGVTVTDFTSTTDEGGNAVVRQPDGRLIVAGSALSGGNDVLALARYHANGVLDSSFDGDGKLVTDVQTTTGEQATAVALQSTGKIVIAGYGQVGAQNEIVLARYLPDGTLDDSFGTAGNGKLAIPLTSGDPERATSLLVLADDSLLVGGSVADPSGFTEQFMLRHLSKDGGVDGTFGDAAGRLTTSFPGAAASERIDGLARQPDGRIVAVGSSPGLTAGEMFEVYVARYMPGGALDPSFAGGQGREAFLLPGGAQGFGYGVAIADDGAIVIGGASGDGNPIVARLTPDGALDTTFGSGGARVIPFDSQAFDGADAFAVGVQSNGGIVAAGDVQQQAQPGGFALMRLEGDSADLSVTESGAPAAVRPGGKVTLTVGAHNAGPQAAHAVNLVLTAPAGVSGMSVTGSGSPAFSCSGFSPVTCTLASLASGATSTLTATYSAPSSGSPHATASISAATFDPQAANNAASSITVLDGTPPAVRFKLGRVTLESLRKHGKLPLAVTLSEAGSVRLAAKAGGRTVASASASFSAAGRRTVVLHVSKRARKRFKGLSSLKLALSATATDTAGNTRKVKLAATIAAGP